MCNHFATAPFALFIFDGGGLSNTFIYLFYLKTSKPQNLKTSKPQNLKTSKPQNLKTSKPQNLALLDNYISSVSYADTFSFRSKVNTLKPRSAREKEKAAF